MYQLQEKQIIWIDETNFNLHCTRNFGRSPKGTRARVPMASSKGRNLHLIGAINADGLLNYTLKRGSFTAEICQLWMQNLIDDLPHQNGESYVIVCDNAPCHSKLEIACEPEHVKLLRLGPYSPALNPIEIIWSVVKSHVKSEMRTNYETIVSSDEQGEIGRAHV